MPSSALRRLEDGLERDALLGTISPSSRGIVFTVLWGVLGPTIQRLRLGEGVLLAINLSIIWCLAPSFGWGVAAAAVSTLALAAMYAFNDLHDAEEDRRNPRKDQVLVDIYVEHRAAFYGLVFAMKVVTVALAWVTLGAGAAGAALSVLLVNMAYSLLLKGVPIIDAVWAGLWGGCYAAIVWPSWRLGTLVALMTGVCHLFQVMGDRKADAENHITTTAVFSDGLTGGLLFAFSAGICLMLWGPFGGLLALSAFVPFVLWLVMTKSYPAWLLTKAYF